ncbi:hypothetical protein DZ944_025795, partial [Pseudomonas aeruginosa]|nr:hypothetical protein [Pseudomonas aeruginosa]
MNGYVGLRDDRRDGERLAARIGLLFPGPSAAWLQRAERLRRWRQRCHWPAWHRYW